MTKISSIFITIIICILSSNAGRQFIHPGITYTQADLDRMKAMIDARREPFYSTFKRFAASSFAQSTATGHTNVTRIPEGQHNNYIGMDGRKAHDNALMWHLTGNKAHADNAVKILNGYLNLTNSSCRGTAPLDNGKIFMLIEAAELMRDYNGWSDSDQGKFKAMLVHPGYSTKPLSSEHYSTNDSLNNVTFYWNIYNFDRARFGNQGLFAARGLMAMGVYLDNDTIYDRAYRYLLGLPHHPDDLPYSSGPAVTGSLKSESEYLIDYNTTYMSTIEDYGYDELLKYYIYQNGQCQESSRDQAHVLAGIGNYTCIAEIAWNQGDSLYNALNNRILKGIEYTLRYNCSLDQTFPEQLLPWEPTGFSDRESDCTFENGLYYQTISRSGRWFGKKISPDQRKSDLGPGGWREQSLAHYKIRSGLPPDSIKWLQRAHDRLIKDYGFENWGESGHHYEWFGWGTLTKRRTVWMAGDAGTFSNSVRVSCLPTVPCTIKAVDYDFFTGEGEGHTYHNTSTVKNTLYRTDGTVEIAQEDNNFFLTDMIDGEWMNYSLHFTSPVVDTITTGMLYPFDICITYRSESDGTTLFAAVDSGVMTGIALEKSVQWTSQCLGTLSVQPGANVLRILVKGQSRNCQLKDIHISPNDNVHSKHTTPVTTSKKPPVIINYYGTGRVSVTAFFPEPVTLQIVSCLGEILYSVHSLPDERVSIGKIFPSGIYFLRVQGEQGLVRQKIVIR